MITDMDKEEEKIQTRKTIQEKREKIYRQGKRKNAEKEEKVDNKEEKMQAKKKRCR